MLIAICSFDNILIIIGVSFNLYLQISNKIIYTCFFNSYHELICHLLTFLKK